MQSSRQHGTRSCLLLDPQFQCPSNPPNLHMQPNARQMQRHPVRHAGQQGAHRPQDALVLPTYSSGYHPQNYTPPSHLNSQVNVRVQGETSQIHLYPNHVRSQSHLSSLDNRNQRIYDNNYLQYQQAPPNVSLSPAQNHRAYSVGVNSSQLQTQHTIPNQNARNQVQYPSNSEMRILNQMLNHPSKSNSNCIPNPHVTQPVPASGPAKDQRKQVAERRRSGSGPRRRSSQNANNQPPINLTENFNRGLSDNTLTISPIAQSLSLNQHPAVRAPEVSNDKNTSGKTMPFPEWIDDDDAAARVYIAHGRIPLFVDFEEQFLADLSMNKWKRRSTKVKSIKTESKSSLVIDLTDNDVTVNDESVRTPRIKPRAIEEIIDKSVVTLTVVSPSSNSVNNEKSNIAEDVVSITPTISSSAPIIGCESNNTMTLYSEIGSCNIIASGKNNLIILNSKELGDKNINNSWNIDETPKSSVKESANFGVNFEARTPTGKGNDSLYNAIINTNNTDKNVNNQCKESNSDCDNSRKYDKFKNLEIEPLIVNKTTSDTTVARLSEDPAVGEVIISIKSEDNHQNKIVDVANEGNHQTESGIVRDASDDSNKLFSEELTPGAITVKPVNLPETPTEKQKPAKGQLAEDRSKYTDIASTSKHEQKKSEKVGHERRKHKKLKFNNEKHGYLFDGPVGENNKPSLKIKLKKCTKSISTDHNSTEIDSKSVAEVCKSKPSLETNADPKLDDTNYVILHPALNVLEEKNAGSNCEQNCNDDIKSPNNNDSNTKKATSRSCKLVDIDMFSSVRERRLLKKKRSNKYYIEKFKIKPCYVKLSTISSMDGVRKKHSSLEKTKSAANISHSPSEPQRTSVIVSNVNNDKGIDCTKGNDISGFGLQKSKLNVTVGINKTKSTETNYSKEKERKISIDDSKQTRFQQKLNETKKRKSTEDEVIKKDKISINTDVILDQSDLRIKRRKSEVELNCSIILNPDILKPTNSKVNNDVKLPFNVNSGNEEEQANKILQQRSHSQKDSPQLSSTNTFNKSKKDKFVLQNNNSEVVAAKIADRQPKNSSPPLRGINETSQDSPKVSSLKRSKSADDSMGSKKIAQKKKSTDGQISSGISPNHEYKIDYVTATNPQTSNVSENMLQPFLEGPKRNESIITKTLSEKQSICLKEVGSHTYSSALEVTNEEKSFLDDSKVVHAKMAGHPPRNLKSPLKYVKLTSHNSPKNSCLKRSESSDDNSIRSNLADSKKKKSSASHVNSRMSPKHENKIGGPAATNPQISNGDLKIQNMFEEVLKSCLEESKSHVPIATNTLSDEQAICLKELKSTYCSVPQVTKIERSFLDNLNNNSKIDNVQEVDLQPRTSLSPGVKKISSESPEVSCLKGTKSCDDSLVASETTTLKEKKSSAEDVSLRVSSKPEHKFDGLIAPNPQTLYDHLTTNRSEDVLRSCLDEPGSSVSIATKTLSDGQVICHKDLRSPSNLVLQMNMEEKSFLDNLNNNSSVDFVKIVDHQARKLLPPEVKETSSGSPYMGCLLESKSSDDNLLTSKKTDPEPKIKSAELHNDNINAPKILRTEEIESLSCKSTEPEDKNKITWTSDTHFPNENMLERSFKFSLLATNSAPDLKSASDQRKFGFIDSVVSLATNERIVLQTMHSSPNECSKDTINTLSFAVSESENNNGSNDKEDRKDDAPSHPCQKPSAPETKDKLKTDYISKVNTNRPIELFNSQQFDQMKLNLMSDKSSNKVVYKDPRLVNIIYCGYPTRVLWNVMNLTESHDWNGQMTSLVAKRRSSTDSLDATKRYLMEGMKFKLPNFDSYTCFVCKVTFTLLIEWGQHSCKQT